MENKVERECPVCGCVYNADPARLKHGRQTTCSRACSYKLRADKKQTSEEVQCGGCGKLFLRPPSLLNRPRHGKVFCSKRCAYDNRQRVVEKPYNRVVVPNYREAMKKHWQTRRANPKPYPESARIKHRAAAIKRLKSGRSVSKFERKAAEVFRSLGFEIHTSAAVRDGGGRFATVFDVVVPARRLVVECHGTFWHGGRWTWDPIVAVQSKNLLYEARKMALAASLGFEMRILWEHDFKSDPVGACLTAVR